MRLGQKSIIHFVSRILASVLGFVATLYVARLLGAEVLGIYSLAVAVVSWLTLFGDMGIGAAVTKRVSEQENSSAYAISGFLLTALLLGIVTVGLLLFDDAVNDYVGFPAVYYIVAMVAVSLLINLITAVLNGQHLVHISGLLGPVKTGGRAGLQIAGLLAGLGLGGLFGGYIIGHLIAIFLALFIVSRAFDDITTPERQHFHRIISFAKFSWLGNLRSRAFNWVDIAVLGFFVNSSLIGYYTAAWNIAMFLTLFGTSLSQTLFPEISKLSAGENPDSVSDLVNTGLSYAGLFLIPGIVGGAILGERILRIYGSDFTAAWLVLVILIAAALVQSYQSQLTSALNAIDRPELAFRANLVFIVTNVTLNALLIHLYGWTGAAVATASAVAISLCVAYYLLSTIVEFAIPIREICYQSVAAVVMGVVVLVALRFEATYINSGHNVAVLLSLVFVGAAVYFIVLLPLSSQFRNTVTNNLPT